MKIKVIFVRSLLYVLLSMPGLNGMTETVMDLINDIIPTPPDVVIQPIDTTWNAIKYDALEDFKKILVEHPDFINKCDNQGRTILIKAIKECTAPDGHIVTWIIDTYPELINKPTRTGLTPLITALGSNTSYKIITKLLKNGVTLDGSFLPVTINALIRTQNTHIINALIDNLKKNGNLQQLNTVDKYGKTALWHVVAQAARKRSIIPSVIVLLLIKKADANPNYALPTHQLPLVETHDEMVESINYADLLGPLYTSNQSILQTLLQCKGNPNGPYNVGQFASPLAIAVAANKNGIAKLLITHKAAVDKEDLLTTAIKNKNPKIIQLLLQAGAQPLEQHKEMVRSEIELLYTLLTYTQTLQPIFSACVQEEKAEKVGF